MIAVLVVVVDEVAGCLLQRPGEVTVLKQDAALQGLVPALDPALALGMVRSAADVIHALILEAGGQIAGDADAAIVGEQAGPVRDGGAVAA